MTAVEHGYLSVDLSAWCNQDLAVLTQPPEPGSVTLRGLPFQIGSRGRELGLLRLRPGDKPVEIHVERTATWLVVAHVLLQSTGMGADVARWILRYADDTTTEWDVRERFEIGVVPAPWGEEPFAALPDTYDAVAGRDAAATGPVLRPTVAAQARSRWFWLWAWRNPYPGRQIQAVTVQGRGGDFAVGGITLSTLDEHPTAVRARRSLRIDPSEPGPGPIEIRVDRGIATFAQPASPLRDELLADPLPGFGAALPGSWTPAIGEVAAAPSATVAVLQAGAEVASATYADLERGEVQGAGARVRVLDTGRNWVHVRIVDDDTGEPVACRIHFRSPDGMPYPPHGHYDHVASDAPFAPCHPADVRLGALTYAYVDGQCQGWLPRGEVVVDAARGFEITPLRTVVRIEPGQRRLELRLRRFAHLRAAGWLCGDSHVHNLSTPACHLQAAGEGLDVVNLLATQWDATYSNLEDFTGRPSVSEDGRTIVYAAQENRQHLLGHLVLWGLRSPVMPWCSDGLEEAEAGGWLEATMSDWADACRKQGGTVVLPHFPSPNGEPATLIATGRVDAVEMVGQGGHDEYYRYLAAGYRLPLVGGTDKMTGDVPLGLVRTYARLDAGVEYTYAAWCAAVCAGRTFVTSGPLIELSVDGAAIGDTVRIGGPGTVEVQARVRSVLPIHELQILVGGKVAAAESDPAGSGDLRIHARVRVGDHTWIAARCGGPGYVPVHRHRDWWARGIFAHTSPIYVACGDTHWWTFDPDAARYMLTLVEGALTYVRTLAPKPIPGTVTHHHGEADHAAHLERPFLEALGALRSRLDEVPRVPGAGPRARA